MKKIIYIADGAPFNSRILAQGPLGGAESACVNFVTALARQGHDVTVYTTADDTYSENNLHWRPLALFVSEAADIVFAHRSPHLFSAYPINARQKILYLHNPAGYLNKWKHRKYIYKHNPDVIFSGAYHASTWPSLLPKSKHYIIPYAIDPTYTQESPRACPSPKAIFTSNPLRSLDWLLDTWSRYIFPHCPQAELHLFTGPEVYRNLKTKKAAAMQAVIQQAEALQDRGVVINKPVPKEQLVDELRSSRVMLYRGDPGESFCLALGEAQAMGVPVVTEGIGSCKERVINSKTGFIAGDQRQFAKFAIELLQDDSLWQSQHHAALNQPSYTWGDAVDLLKLNAEVTTHL
jgi:glycosyltransferase involved in cell wall biosynthesis